MAETLAHLLEERALETPQQDFARIDGEALTYGQVNSESDRLAQALAIRGVRAGEPVGVMLPNCSDYVFAWMALSKLGAPTAGIRTIARDQILVAMINLLGCRVLIVDAPLLASVIEVGHLLETLETIVVRGDRLGLDREAQASFEIVFLTELGMSAADDAGPEAAVSGEDLALLLFTSGTTGSVPKACMVSHRTAIRMAEVHATSLGYTSSDVMHSPLPLFHTDATILTVVPALVLGATAAIGQGFKPETYWDEIRSLGATVTGFMGDSLNLLAKQPARPTDKENPLRRVWGANYPDLATAAEFEERFDTELTSNYGLTDAGIVVYYPLDEPKRPRAVGKPVYPYEVKIFNAQDEPLEPDEVGQIVIRPLESWATTSGYFRQPEVTLARLRNLWFHTGDFGYIDDDGFLYMIGRDPNEIEGPILSQIEDAVTMHPAVLESCAVTVEDGDASEIKICVVPRPGESLEAEDIWTHCQTRLDDASVPRYVEFVSGLHKNPTHKVERHKYQEEWLTPATKDLHGTGPVDN